MHASKPQFSVIIPTLNEESVLRETLSSLTRSGLRHYYEVIVSDGGSTDKTVLIAKAYADTVVENATGVRQTIGLGRNAGAEHARGDLLLFLDADCSFEDVDAMFCSALEHFLADPQLVALTSPVCVLKEFETRRDRFFQGVTNLVIRFTNNVLHKPQCLGEFQMIRRKAFDKVEGYSTKLVTREDTDMFLRLAKIGKTRCANNICVYHTGRRAHKVGWLRLTFDLAVNSITIALTGKAYFKEWEVIR